METWLKWSAPVFCFLAALPHVSLVVGLMLVDPKIVTLSSAYGVSPTSSVSREACTGPVR